MIVLGLVALRTPIYAQNEAELWEAIARGDLNTLQRALESGLDPDVREPNGATPLIVAAMFGHLDLVRLLVENNAALDVQNNDGTTALYVASLFGHPDAVKLLLKEGAARDTRNNDGVTALETVSGPWSDELRELYEFLGSIFQMELDIDRIRDVRPEIRTLLRAAR